MDQACFIVVKWSSRFIMSVLVWCLCHLGATTQYVRYCFLIIVTYSTISFFNTLLQLFFPAGLGINQLLSYRCVKRQDYVRDVLPTLKFVI